MCKLSAAVFSTLLSAVLLPQSFAANVTYEIKGRVSGSPMANTDLGYFTFDIEKARTTVQEELPSGIKHNRYEFNFVVFSGFPPLPSLNYDYRIYNQSGGGTFLSPYGDFQNFSIDQYLQSDGSSALSIHGSIRPGCHGGCFIEGEFSLDYTSSGSGLFENLAQPLSFDALSSATGNSVYSVINFVPVTSTMRTITDFDITSTAVVPEMDAWIFLLTGLGFGACYLSRKTLAHSDIVLKGAA